MNINIYYGGRGLIDDPTLFVVNKMQEVLEELRVNVERYQLQDLKNNITTLPQTLKEADGIILATTVEWYGIGGYLQQFLDACWLYGDKEKISSIYMCPVVISTTYGEREAKLNLVSAWEILGGKHCSGVSGYVADIAVLEENEAYITLIEKKAENMYRTVNQKTVNLPASNQAIRQMVSRTQIELTPQESEQLSRYASDDKYVQQQKEDIQELTSLFRDLMGSGETDEMEEMVSRFRQCFHPQFGVMGVFKLVISGKKYLVLKINNDDLEFSFENTDQANVEMSLEKRSLEEILHGRMTFQRAFMSGEMKMKGDFKALRTMDQVFEF